MERKDILSSADYWVTLIQTRLYDCAARFMEREGLSRTQLAERLSVTKSYVSQLLNGDYDHRLSKMVELALAFGYMPKIDFVSIEDYILSNECKATASTFTQSNVQFCLTDNFNKEYDSQWNSYTLPLEKEVA